MYQQSPEAPEAASTYGWVLFKLGRLDDAEKWLQAAVSSGSVMPDTAYYYARWRKLETAIRWPGSGWKAR